MATNRSRDTYLAALQSELACFARNRELVQEVTAHFDESVDSLQRSGVEPDAAVGQAIARLGTPKEIASAFAVQGEPLAVPTRFTRFAGLLAIVALPFWVATFALMAGSEWAERSREWDGLPQTLFMLAMVTMMVATVGFLFAGLGLSRRIGNFGTWGVVATGLLGLGIALSLMAWFVPAWAIVMTVALGILWFRLRKQESRYANHVAVATAGALGALVSFFVLAATGTESGWSIAFAMVLISASALALIGFDLMREPHVETPLRVA